jgi:ubiquinone/menaquinone biosynthesis C-methylase UbiE
MQNDEQKKLAETIRLLYNAHPFPNRGSMPSQSDERSKHIFKEFLHIPVDQLSGKIWLDAGCGTGENTWAWRRNLDQSTRIVGVDLSEASIGIARQQGSIDMARPLFAVHSLLDLGIKSNSVDVILCSGVLTNIIDPEAAYQELVRVLKPGGYMILILYHLYGRFIHGLRRAVIDALERDDVDRRAEIGKKLFSRSMVKLAVKHNAPFEGVVYDQLAHPHENRFSVEHALKWFKEANICYLGSWPPAEWSQFGKGLRFSYHLSPRLNNLPGRMLLRIFPDTDQYPSSDPDLFSRVSMQVVWTVAQQQLFAMSGRKM